MPVSLLLLGIMMNFQKQPSMITRFHWIQLVVLLNRRQKARQKVPQLARPRFAPQAPPQLPQLATANAISSMTASTTAGLSTFSTTASPVETQAGPTFVSTMINPDKYVKCVMFDVTATEDITIDCMVPQ